MFFIILTFCAALFIEGLGSLVSVIGISALFGANVIIIALAIALDVGKIVTVSLLYTHWKELKPLMKGYALLAATVTMIITSAGAAGYLQGEFQKAIVGTKEGELKVAVLKEQQAKYQERKKQIDDQIANLPARTTVNQRLRLINGFKVEQKSLDEKIAQIDKDLPALQVAQIGTEAKAGPIISIAKAFKIPVEEAVTWVIGMIIFVFDPLAIFLIIAGNFLLARRKAELEAKAIVVEPVYDPQPQSVEIDNQLMSMPAGHDFPYKPVPGQFFYHTMKRQPFYYADGKWEEYKPPAASQPTPEPEPIVEETIVEESTPAVEEIVETPSEPEPVVEEPTPVILDKVDLPEPEPVVEEPEVIDRRSIVSTGLLKPVKVEQPDEGSVSHDGLIPLTILPKEEGSVELVETAVVEEVPPQREEITRSTLGLVEPDPNTIVDVRRGRASNFVTPAKR